MNATNPRMDNGQNFMREMINEIEKGLKRRKSWDN
jgi:hypothetical protein